MFIAETKIRVHYALTDQMGVVYHGRYAEFFEIGRTDSLRQLGFTYKDIEKSGIITPIVEMNMRFLQPARYDDLLTVKTILNTLPADHRIVFDGEIFNEKGDKLCVSQITLYYVNAKDMSRAQMPEHWRDALLPYFKPESTAG